MSSTSEAVASGSGVAAARRVPWTEVARLAFLGLQLGVALLLARAFQLEHPAFYGVVLYSNWRVLNGQKGFF